MGGTPIPFYFSEARAMRGIDGDVPSVMWHCDGTESLMPLCDQSLTQGEKLLAMYNGGWATRALLIVRRGDVLRRHITTVQGAMVRSDRDGRSSHPYLFRRLA